MKAQEQLQQIVGEASQILEVAMFREHHVADMGSNSEKVAERWKRILIKEITDGEESDPYPTTDEFRSNLTKKVMQELRLTSSILNSAALVLVHSFFDAFLTDLLRVTVTARGETWSKRAEEKGLSFKQVLNSNPNDLEIELIEADFKNVEKQSMLLRMELLIKLCKERWTESRPPKEFSPNVVQDYKYDKKRLGEIDRKRQNIIHHKAMDQDISLEIDKHIEFLWLTLVNMIQLVSISFILPVDLSPSNETRIADRRMVLSFEFQKSEEGKPERVKMKFGEDFGIGE